MTTAVRIDDFSLAMAATPLAACMPAAPWAFTSRSEELVRAALAALSPTDWRIENEVAVHRSATVERGAQLKAPVVVGAGCFVGATALLRGGVWLGARCNVGPGCELKASFIGDGTRLAHFNFVADSVIGADVNFEAGSVVANCRNERDDGDRRIRVRVGVALHTLHVSKFGALVGDGARIGANAVLAPGTLLAARTVVARLALIDQEAGGA